LMGRKLKPGLSFRPINIEVGALLP
jgi:hypothetical protein